jgi:hypothetical protein
MPPSISVQSPPALMRVSPATLPPQCCRRPPVNQAATVTSPVRSEEKMKPHHDHPAGNETATTRPAAPSPAPDHPLEITHAQMDAAHETGQAVPFSQTAPGSSATTPPGGSSTNAAGSASPTS